MLLDNALSAVDQHTANHIFDNLIRGTFRTKAVVLITHQLEFLPKCDNVAVMDGGKCLYFGPWNAQCGQILSRLLPVNHLLEAAKESDKDGPNRADSMDRSNSDK